MKTDNLDINEISKYLAQIAANQDNLMTIVHGLVVNFAKLKKELGDKNIEVSCDLKIDEVRIH